MVLSRRFFCWFVLTIINVVPQTIAAIETNMRSTVPGVYIVEFSSSFSRQRLDNHHEFFYQKLARMKKVVTPRLNLTSRLFHGASFHLNNHEDISEIVALEMVSTIWPVTLYSRPKPTVESIFELSILDNNIANETIESLSATHIMGGVDKLHDQGYDGKGVFIAVIDSGVDYKHPALGGGFGKGYKIQYGFDLVGDDYTGDNMPNPDPYPLDCGGHGTHVSGIIGANAPTFSGVAPNATLGMYRVFGCAGGSANDILIAAFSAAYEDDAQIITASLGSPYGWTEDPLAVVVSRIARAGVPCTIAAGNDGGSGLFFASTPADGIDTIAVGSVNSITIPISSYQGYFANNSENNITFSYFSANDPFPTNISGYSLYALSLNTSNPADACNELPDSNLTLSDKIVLIRRGTCAFQTKIHNVQKFGAQYILFYNNENPIIKPQSISGVFAAMVTAEQGAQWINDLREKYDITLSFPENSIATILVFPNNVTGGTMSTFSSWSPTNELYVKPEVSAPGGTILSTYPLHLGGYAVLSGTSMATPYIAGALALYMNARGSQTKIDYQIFRQVLATTATPLSFNDGFQTYSYLAPVVQQGGGLVNAFAAIHYTTVVSPSILALNDTVNFNRTVQFMISNTGLTSMSYTLIHKPAATVYALIEESILVDNFPPERSTQYASAIISPSDLTIPGNSSAIIRVTFTSPLVLQTARIPVFSGYINIQSDNNESLHLPYVGIGCKMKNVRVTDFENSRPYISNSTDVSVTPKPVSTNVVFNLSTNQPKFNWRLVMPSPLVRLDVLGSGNLTEVAGFNILGSVPGFPAYWIPRNDWTYFGNHLSATWNGTLSNGIQVPTGNYKFLYRALKIFGDATNKSDYESWESPVFGIENGIQENISASTIQNKAHIKSTYHITISFSLIVVFILFISK